MYNKRKIKFLPFKLHVIFIILLILIELRVIEKNEKITNSSKIPKVSVFLPISHLKKFFRKFHCLREGNAEKFMLFKCFEV